MMMPPPDTPDTLAVLSAEDPCGTSYPTPSTLFVDPLGRSELVDCPLPGDPLEAAGVDPGEIDLFRRMAAESGRPISVSVAQGPRRPDDWRDELDAFARFEVRA